MALASTLLALFGVASAQVQDGSIAARESSAHGQYDIPSPAAGSTAVVGGGSQNPGLKNPLDVATGACCLSSGACESVSESRCSQRSGSYRGDGISCDPNPCPLRRAAPDPQYCTVTPLLGNPSVPSSQVAFLAPGSINGTTITISVKSSSNAPIPGAAVFVSFNFAIKTCTTAVHAATTNASGVCTITLRGGGCLSGVAGACVITANGIQIKSLQNVRSPDNNSRTLSAPDGRVSVTDLAFFGDEYLGNAPPGCHDYDNNGLCDLTDLTYFGDPFNIGIICVLSP
jgi:hypothetical protein